MAELPRWVLTHAKKLNKLGLIRVDLRRSWQIHSWLALTFTVGGAVLAALYLVTSWPDPAPPAQIGAVVSNAVVILLSGVVLGITAAVIVQSMDRKVYSGEDIEYMLGVEPMIELPDLAQLSNDETRELMLPLAGGIIHACPDDAQRRCIFTGTGPGSGVSAVAARTRETLEAIGRSVVLVDAAGATPEIGGDKAQDEGVAERESLILTDTAPLVSSADTEYLARFADCVIVVAESGITTREQLRNTVRSLQRLNVAAVGFVLNRVKEPRASVAPHRSSSASAISSEQFSAAVRRALAHAPRRTEARPKPTPRPQPAASLTAVRETTKRVNPLANLKQAPQSVTLQTPGVPRWMSDALAELEASHPGHGGKQAADNPAKRNQQENLAGETTKAPMEPGTPIVMENPSESAAPAGQAEGVPFSNGSKDARGGSAITPHTVQAMPASAAGEVSGKRLSRLSGLRGIVSTDRLRELRQSRRLEAVTSETTAQSYEAGQGQTEDALPSGLPPAAAEAVEGSSRGLTGRSTARLDDLRGLVGPGDLKELNQAKSPLTVADEAAEQGNRSAPIAEEQTSARKATGEASGPEVDTARTSAGVPSKPTVASERDHRANYGDVQVLPSWRGQYRKK
jgi:hypothetical protein